MGEKRGHSLGPFSTLPTRKAKMSAAQVTTNSRSIQATPCDIDQLKVSPDGLRSQTSAMQAGAM